MTKEQGKTLPDAEGDVMRGLQVVEQACSLTFMQMGATLPGIAKDIDCASYRVPLGVTAGWLLFFVFFLRSQRTTTRVNAECETKASHRSIFRP